MTDLELVDAQRLAEALERLEAGIDPDLDPREDPSLSALVALAAEIRDVEELATDAQRYRSYRERSRDHVLRRIGREALPRETLPAQIAPTQVLSTQIIPTALVPVVVEEPRQRRRPFLHWSYLAPVASAAAAAVAVLAFIAAQPDAAGEPVGDAQAAAADAAPAAAPTETVAQIEPPSGFGSLEPDPPLPVEVLPAAPAEGSITQGSIESELERINQLIGTVTQQVADGAPVEAELLRSITESTAAVADRIERQPDSVSRLDVITYIQAAALGRTVLAAVTADAESEDALSAARRAAQDGVVAASAYFQQRP